MVLHRERGECLVPYAFNRPVVEIHVSHFKAFWNGFRHHCEVVVLAGDLNLARREILHRMVAAVVPELEPRRLRAARERE